MAVPDSVSDEAAAQVHCGMGCTSSGALSCANDSCRTLGAWRVSCQGCHSCSPGFNPASRCCVQLLMSSCRWHAGLGVWASMHKADALMLPCSS